MFWYPDTCAGICLIEIPRIGNVDDWANPIVIKRCACHQGLSDRQVVEAILETQRNIQTARAIIRKRLNLPTEKTVDGELVANIIPIKIDPVTFAITVGETVRDPIEAIRLSTEVDLQMTRTKPGAQVVRSG